MNILYGIKNCDTVRKAQKWLTSKGVDYTFHDFRADGLLKKDLNAWTESIGWETLLNKRSTTWKKLADRDKQTLNQRKAISLMLANPTLIKRPVLKKGNKVTVGFNSDEYALLFKKN